MGGGVGQEKKERKETFQYFRSLASCFSTAEKALLTWTVGISFVKSCCVVQDAHTVWQHGHEEGSRHGDG